MTATPDERAREEALPDRPLLPGFFRVIPMGPDAIQLRSAGRVLRLSAPGLGETALPLLAALDGRSTLADLGHQFGVEPSVLAGLIGPLVRQGIVWDAAATADAGEVAPFDEVLADGGSAHQVRATVAASRLALVGVGPVSRAAAGQLAASGVGELTFVDDPWPDADNQRSCLDRMVDEARRAAPAATVTARPASDLEAVVADSDLVVVEVDPSTERADRANLACLAAKVQLLVHETATFQAFVGPTVEPFDSACYRCVDNRRSSHLRYYDEQFAYRQQLRSGNIPPLAPALLPGAVALVAGLVSIEALRTLGGFAPAVTRQGVLVVDLRSLEIGREDVLPVPDCRACGDPPLEHIG